MEKCNVCKALFPKSKLSPANKNQRIVYYTCRACNTKRCRKYAATKRGKQAINEASKRSYRKHKNKWLARRKVRYAVKSGKIIKPNKCEKCLLVSELQAHHTDYTKPLEVIWLCSGCHADIH